MLVWLLATFNCSFPSESPAYLLYLIVFGVCIQGLLAFGGRPRVCLIFTLASSCFWLLAHPLPCSTPFSSLVSSLS